LLLPRLDFLLVFSDNEAEKKEEASDGNDHASSKELCETVPKQADFSVQFNLPIGILGKISFW